MSTSQPLDSSRKGYKAAAPATAEYKKPLPRILANNQPFFDAAKKHELRLPKCKACGHISYPPEMFCPKCLSNDLYWPKLSGKGKVWSFIFMHQTYFPAFGDEIPYNIAFVQLDDAPNVWMCTNLTGIKNEDIKCDIPVEAVFEDVTKEVTLVKFCPCATAATDDTNVKPAATKR